MSNRTLKIAGLLLLFFTGLSPHAYPAPTNSPDTNPGPNSTSAKSNLPGKSQNTPANDSRDLPNELESIRKRGDAILSAREKKAVQGPVEKDSVVAPATTAQTGTDSNTGEENQSAQSASQSTIGSFTSTNAQRKLFPSDEVTATKAGPAEFNLDSDTSSGSWFIQTIFALAVVLALIYLLRSFMMKLSGTTAAGVNAALIEVLARTNIGPKTHVLFLKVNQKVIIAGQTPAGLNPLATLEDPEEVAWILGQVESTKANSISQGFKKLMQGFDKEYQPDVVTDETGNDTDEHLVDRSHEEVSGLLARLKHLQNKLTNSNSNDNS